MKRNKKVANAKPNSYNGINFRSKLETFCYKALEVDFPDSFEYEKNKYTIFKDFYFKKEHVRPITIKPDFVSKELKVIIEVKGFPNDAWPLRLKLFKKLLSTKYKDWDFYICKNQSEIKEVIRVIKLTNLKKDDKSTYTYHS